MCKTFTRLRLLLPLLLFIAPLATAEDGYDLWLRYAALEQGTGQSVSVKVAEQAQSLVFATSDSATAVLAQQELSSGLNSLLKTEVPVSGELGNGSVLLATPSHLSALNSRNLPYAELGDEGYLVRQLDMGGNATTLITANTDIGLLYGVFGYLRELQTSDDFGNVNVVSVPSIELRLLNHWDNLDRSVERGYAGQSIWDWWRLPGYVDQGYTDYARANASVGINGTVLNNVNSNAQILTPRFLEKVAVIAEQLRPWGMKVYLSARFSAPQEIGGLPTSDPLDAGVQQWWNDKASEIYALIPDFGGFLVKANSEGQPGPQDFGRTHADGANMLARAVAPHNGVVMWRAFVYSDVNPEDRAKQAYTEFKPLDGGFLDNVIIQVKNGPIDFQPREPFHPMFGAFPETPLMMEFQITKEYLGFATHLAYLGPMYEEVLQTDTYGEGQDSTVAKVVDGSLHNYSRTAIAGVANIGSDRDWSGSDFNQANWYLYGRMAWNPELSAEAIAREWLKQTYSRHPEFVETATDMMMDSREAVVNYMTPLGLAHLMATGHHYGPGPWVDDLGRPEWNPAYYHRANKDGIGFDRTESGSDALSQYADEVAALYDNADTIDDEFLLWFHHVPWQHEMESGRNLWEELVLHYDTGVEQVETMVEQWNSLEDFVDAERFTKTRQMLQIQLREAIWWRDSSIAYWLSINGLSLPEGVRPPAESLEYYKNLSFPNAPG